MPEPTGPPFPAAAWLWPALAAEQASEFASFVAKEIANFAIGPVTEPSAPEPSWTTCNEVLLELDSVRLRDFSTSADGIATLICAPYALHGATMTDFAPGHSLVAALKAAGLERLFVTDWRSANPEMRFRSIDNYLADLNVLVDQLDGEVNLVGLCQGGWMALIYAARFPSKVRKLALAGAPIDICAGKSRLSELARNTPISIFREFVEIGNGRALGHRLLQVWDQTSLDHIAIQKILQASDATGSPAFQDLESRFRQWRAWTLDLPGTYYLQVVEQLFKENQLAAGRFVALGRRIDFSSLRCPMFLLAARDDEIVAPEQLFAVQRLVDRNGRPRKAVAPCTHLGLFMGRATLSDFWPAIARWLARSATGQGEPP
jgi:poly(3-hydroxybutyrate) depolymerase